MALIQSPYFFPSIYVADNITDLPTNNVEFGARASVLSTNTTYIFGSDGAWHATGGWKAFTVPFTDGDVWRRVTVTDTSVVVTSKIATRITRPTVTAANDRGYVYFANVVSQTAGSFDVNIIVLDWGGEVPSEVPPNEAIVLLYSVN